MGRNNENFFLGRQPILNRRQEIVGYELLFRATNTDHAEFDSYSHACTSVITSALTNFGLQEVLGGKFGFINIHLGLFLSELLELLPIGQSVLELLEIIKLDDNVAERCRELRKLGFKMALDDHVYSPDYHQIYSVVDYIKIDILDTPLAELPEIVRKLRQWPVKLLAEKVETVELDAVGSRGRRQVEHGVQADEWLGARRALADHARPGRVVQLRVVIGMIHGWVLG